MPVNIPSPYTAGGGGGSGTVTSVTAADTSIVVTGTPTVAPTLATGTLDVIAADHPPGANWSNNSHKITSLANGSAAQDAAAFGQIPTSAGSIGGLLAANNLSDVAAQQTALNNLAGAVTNHDVLAGNGTNVTMRALAAADIPGTLNATTFAGNVTGQDGLLMNSVQTKTAASYTVNTSTDFLLLGDTTSNNVVFALPDATTCKGQIFVFACVQDNNAVTFTTVSSQTIAGTAASNWVLSQKGNAFILQSDGANWQAIGSQGTAVTFACTNFFAFGVSKLEGGSDTSHGASASSPSFTSGTAAQLSTSTDVMLYIAIQTAAALAVAIGPANTTTTALMPSQTYALGLISIRVPQGWWVKITGTIADLTISAVTC